MAGPKKVVRILAAVVAATMAAWFGVVIPAQAAGDPARTAGGAQGVQYRPAEWGDLPGWASDPLDGLDAALDAQCAPQANRALPPSRTLSLDALCAPSRPRQAPSLRAWLEREFRPVAIEGADEAGDSPSEGLITGYYEPLLRGSRTAGGAYRTPLYGRPVDLVSIDLGTIVPQTAGLALRGRLAGARVVPYPDRARIDAGALPASAALLWVDDPVEAFFLHVQGSGRVRLDDGSTVRLAFADHNGHPYTPIGRTLVERGEIARDAVDAAAIKSWLRAHPALRDEVLRTNPRYVFFAEQPAGRADVAAGAPAGPRGAMGVSLTPQRSVAVDARFVPLGTPVWIDTPHPSGSGRLARAFVAQDTGGAIRGAPRADVFWGSGAEAEQAAGRMRSTGRMWLLWPRGAPLPRE